MAAQPAEFAGNHKLPDDEQAAPMTTTTGGHDTTLALDNTKAGMAAVDKATVERIINEASRGSKFYVNEQRKAKARAARLERAQKKLAEFDAGTVQKLPLQRHCDDVLREARERTALGNYVHLDMDAFYAAVEELLNPALKGVPFGVGGMGMLSTSNYAARAYGVRAGMPGYIAKKLCPQLVFAFSGFEHYRRFSDIVRGIVAEYDPNFVSRGLDELTLNAQPFLDRQAAKWADNASGSVGDNPRPSGGKTTELVDSGELELPQHADTSVVRTVAELSWEIRARVYKATQLTASTGIAPTPALSKILSNFEKPDGQSELTAASLDDLQAFMAAQPIRRIAGVGRVMDELLQGLGYTTCAEVFRDRVRLCHALTPKTFDFLLTACIGCQGTFDAFGHEGHEEGTEVKTEPGEEGSAVAAAEVKRKSIGAERTFGTMPSLVAFMQKAESVFDKAFGGLVEEGLVSRQVGLKLKRKTFDVHQTTANLVAATDDRDTLWAAFEGLVLAHASSFADFRLMGVRFADLFVKGHEPPPRAIPAAPTTPEARRAAKAPAPTQAAGTPTLEALFAAAKDRRPKRERAVVDLLSSSSSASSDDDHDGTEDDDDIDIISTFDNSGTNTAAGATAAVTSISARRDEPREAADVITVTSDSE